jgi:PAS domain-containing protein
MKNDIVVLTNAPHHALVEIARAEAIPVEGDGADQILPTLLAEQPAVLIVDVTTLGTSGLGLISGLVAYDELRHTLTVALVQPDAASVEEAMRAGADDFLTIDQIHHVTTRVRLELHVRHVALISRGGGSTHKLPSERPPGSGEIASVRTTAERRLKRFQPYVDFFKNSADGMVVMDRDGRILFANPQARAIGPREDADLHAALHPALPCGR